MTERLYRYKARLVKAVDGDTARLDIDLGMKVHRIEDVRLNGIDAPERNSKDPVEREKALESTNRLIELLDGGDLFVITMKDRDEKFGRLLGEIYPILTQHPDGSLEVSPKSASQILLEEGLAKPYSGGKR